MKIKLKNTASAAEPEANSTPTQLPPQEAAPKQAFKLKLNRNPDELAPPAATDNAPAVKPKRKYTKKPKFDEDGNPIVPAPKGPGKGKKRQREDGDDAEASPAVKRKSKGAPAVQDVDSTTVPSSRTRIAPTRKLTIKTAASKIGAPQIKLKHQGKPPVRPPGVGYDSEAEDAEIDPAIESQFVLRMQPGEYCQLLRRAIDEKTIGKGERGGGPAVWFRFFDKEGRRSMVHIKDKNFAAMMVDLPCVIESMKSWNRKDWVKAADVCQMLLVLGEVRNEDEAKAYPVPSTVDMSTYQYAHGLTPPMHWVRKRRFRPRTNYRKIEEVEEAVEKLLALDKLAKESGGSSKFDIIDPTVLEREEESPSEDEMEDDEEQPYEDEVVYEDEDQDMDEVDADEMARMMAEQLGEEDGDLFGEAETPAATSHDVAMHALGSDAAAAAIAAETPGSTSHGDTESADDDDDADAASEEDIDEDALIAQQELEQQREEIADMEKEIQSQHDSLKGITNVLMRKRIEQKIKSLSTDLQIKKDKLAEMLGEEAD